MSQCKNMWDWESLVQPPWIMQSILLSNRKFFQKEGCGLAARGEVVSAQVYGEEVLDV